MPTFTSAPTQWCSTRSEEHTSELQSHSDLVCSLLLEKKKGRTGDDANAATADAEALQDFIADPDLFLGLGRELFSFNDPATTEIYALSLHDALPISSARGSSMRSGFRGLPGATSTRTIGPMRSEEHTSELQSHSDIVCRLLLEK